MKQASFPLNVEASLGFVLSSFLFLNSCPVLSHLVTRLQFSSVQFSSVAQSVFQDLRYVKPIISEAIFSIPASPLDCRLISYAYSPSLPGCFPNVCLNIEIQSPTPPYIFLSHLFFLLAFSVLENSIRFTQLYHFRHLPHLALRTHLSLRFIFLYPEFPLNTFTSLRLHRGPLPSIKLPHPLSRVTRVTF